MIFWYLTSRSKVMVTPTVLEESSQANKLLSSRRPSGWGFELWPWWTRCRLSFIWMFIVYNLQHLNVYPIRDIMKYLSIHCNHRVILITVSAENPTSWQGKQLDICCIQTNRQPKQTDRQTCCRHRHGSCVRSPLAGRADLQAPASATAGGRTSCGLQHRTSQDGGAQQGCLRNLQRNFFNIRQLVKKFWGISCSKIWK